jgi:hypothetical protein
MRARMEQLRIRDSGIDSCSGSELWFRIYGLMHVPWEIIRSLEPKKPQNLKPTLTLKTIPMPGRTGISHDC